MGSAFERKLFFSCGSESALELGRGAERESNGGVGGGLKLPRSE